MSGPDQPALTDSYGRVHRDLRVSVTDRCQLRCAYCMPAEGVAWLPAATLLTADEIVRLVGVATSLGIDRVRLTGGEPLMRSDLDVIVAGVAGLPSHPAVAMTTNGIGLAERARELAGAGLQRVNVSLDTVDPGRFAAVTRRAGLDQVLRGLDAAVEAGLTPVKINAVLRRDVNDQDALALLDFAARRGFELRFIEQMPLDGGHAWTRAGMVSADEVLLALGSRHTLTALPDQGHSPAALWLIDGGPATVGIVAAVSRPFCAECDRLRLTADGYLRNCLFALDEVDVRTPLRTGASDDDLAAIFRRCVASKGPGHGIDRPGFRQPARPMSAIGG